MVNSCAVTFCNTKFVPNSIIKCHQVPKDAIIFTKWCKKLNKQLGKYARICSEHFTEDDYTLLSTGRKQLKGTAVPSKFPENPELNSKNDLKDVKSLIDILSGDPDENNIDISNLESIKNTKDLKDGNQEQNLSDILSGNPDQIKIEVNYSQSPKKSQDISTGLVCAIKGCSWKCTKNGKISFYSFPKNPVLRQKWMEFVKIFSHPHWVLKKNHRICSKHFDKNIFGMKENGVKFLQPGSVPTIGIEEPIFYEEVEYLIDEEEEKGKQIKESIKSDNYSLPEKEVSVPIPTTNLNIEKDIIKTIATTELKTTNTIISEEKIQPLSKLKKLKRTTPITSNTSTKRKNVNFVYIKLNSCLICLKNEGKYSIYDKKISQPLLVNIINSFVDVKIIRNDELPNSVCNNCADKIFDYQKLKQQCDNSIKIFYALQTSLVKTARSRIIEKDDIEGDGVEDDDIEKDDVSEEDIEKDVVNEEDIEKNDVNEEDIEKEIIEKDNTNVSKNIENIVDHNYHKFNSVQTNMNNDKKSSTVDNKRKYGCEFGSEFINYLKRAKIIDNSITEASTNLNPRNERNQQNKKEDEINDESSRVLSSEINDVFLEESNDGFNEEINGDSNEVTIDQYNEDLDEMKVDYLESDENDFFCSFDNTISNECNKSSNNILDTNVTTDSFNKSENNNLCEICSAEFNSNESLAEHKLTHNLPQFKCKICEKLFHTEKALKYHEKRHEGIRHSCDYCDKTFSSTGCVNDHIKSIHFGLKRFKCIICDKEYFNSYNYQIHILTHSGEKKYECEVCKARFTQRPSLKIHLEKHHNIIRSTRKGFKIKEDKQVFKCHICLKLLPNSEDLKKHFSSHSGALVFHCQICPMKYSSVRTLKEHVKSHKAVKTFDCIYCDETFSTYAEIRAHEKSHRPN